MNDIIRVVYDMQEFKSSRYVLHPSVIWVESETYEDNESLTVY